MEPDVSALYAELHGLAHGVTRRERGEHTLQTTALVHEAWERLGPGGGWSNRNHFLGAAANTMRRILVEHARGRDRDERGGGAAREPLDERSIADAYSDAVDLLALDAALDRLASRNLQAAEIVERRFFAGLSLPEIATSCKIALRTVERHFRFARAYLHRELGGPIEPGEPTE